MMGQFLAAQELEVDIACSTEAASCNGTGPNNGLFAFEISVVGGSGTAAQLSLYEISGTDTVSTVELDFTGSVTTQEYSEGNNNYSIVVTYDGQELMQNQIIIECTGAAIPTGTAGMDDFPDGAIQEVCYGDDVVVEAACIYVPNNNYSTASYVLFPSGGVLPEDAIAWSNDGQFPFTAVEEAGLVGEALLVSGVIGWNTGALTNGDQPEGIIEYEGVVAVVVMGQALTILNNGINELFSCGEEVLLYPPPGSEVIEWSTGATSDSISVTGVTGWNSYSISVMGDDGCTMIDSVQVYFDDSCVWPGDANYDGVADNYDVLALGLAFNQSGTERDDASIDYEAQPSADWPQSFDDGTNFKHADCNGDGQVNANDLGAILANYSQLHERSGTSGTSGDDDPPLVLQLPESALSAGTLIEFPILLGMEDLPAIDIYGLAFSIEFDNTLIQEESVEIIFTESWLFDNEPEELLSISREQFDDGIVSAAVTRTDQMNKSGFGVIGIIRGVLIENIEFKSEVEIDISMNITEVNLISTESEFLPVFTMDQIFTVTAVETGLTENTSDNSLSVYPVPANDALFFELKSGIQVEEIELIALDGSVVKNYRNPTTSIDLSEVQSGLYFVLIHSSEGLLSRKIQVTR